jgi:hypothetical protein
VARKSFVKQMRRWRRRSNAALMADVERVVVNATDHVVEPQRIVPPRLQAVSVSLEEHGLVVTSGRTRHREHLSADSSLRDSFRRTFTIRTES